MSSSAVQRFYRYHAHVYDATRWLILPGRREAVGALGLRPNSTVLEIGCGTGWNFSIIAKRLDPERGHVVGLDFSEAMLAKARKRLTVKGLGHFELIRGDATDLRLDRSFDAVLFAYSLSMIDGWEAAIDRAVEHLAPGGRLVVLDFGEFDAWGPAAPAIRAWLGLHHVRVRRPYLQALARRLNTLRVRRGLGGYFFMAAGVR